MKQTRTRSEVAAEVRKLAATGAAERDIAAILEVPEEKLCKRFQKDLVRGAAEGKQTALNKIYEIAVAGEHLNALTFWVKSRCRWRDTGEAKSGETLVLKPVITINRIPTPKPESAERNPSIES